MGSSRKCQPGSTCISTASPLPHYPTLQNNPNTTTAFTIRRLSELRASKHVHPHRLYTTRTPPHNMPLVVPGLQSKDGNSNDDWMSKLMGKKLGDQHDEMTFAKTDLPQQHRVLNEGDMKTMDFQPERLNVHLDKDGTINKITKG